MIVSPSSHQTPRRSTLAKPLSLPLLRGADQAILLMKCSIWTRCVRIPWSKFTMHAKQWILHCIYQELVTWGKSQSWRQRGKRSRPFNIACTVPVKLWLLTFLLLRLLSQHEIQWGKEKDFRLENSYGGNSCALKPEGRAFFCCASIYFSSWGTMALAGNPHNNCGAIQCGRIYLLPLSSIYLRWSWLSGEFWSKAICNFFYWALLACLFALQCQHKEGERVERRRATCCWPCQ